MLCARFALLAMLFATAVHADSLRVTKAVAEIAELRQQVEAYRVDHGAYPKSLDDVRPGQHSLDPWGQPYVYRASDRTLVLYSTGKNGSDEQGQGDDVVSWNLLRHEFYPEVGARGPVRWLIPIAIGIGLAGSLWVYSRRNRTIA